MKYVIDQLHLFRGFAMRDQKTYEVFQRDIEKDDWNQYIRYKQLHHITCIVLDVFSDRKLCEGIRQYKGNFISSLIQGLQPFS